MLIYTGANNDIHPTLHQNISMQQLQQLQQLQNPAAPTQAANPAVPNGHSNSAPAHIIQQLPPNSQVWEFNYEIKFH